MNIIGPDALIFAVDDIEGTTKYLTDYGLTAVNAGAGGGRFETQDGTAIVIAAMDDPSLPPPLPSGSSVRKMVYGVDTAETVEAIAAELGKDREVRRLADGAIEAKDDNGFTIGFQVTIRRPLDLPAEPINAPGAKPQRGPNQLGVDVQASPKPRSLSHFAAFTPDAAKDEAFYVNRLGFRVTDRLLGAGMFLQPAGTLEHHALFLINTPPHMQGIEHIAFHLGGPNDVMVAGTRFLKLGYQSFWGPGRHTFGSNWFWYFNSPLGCRFEYDADMDLHDKNWVPREVQASADATQVYLFQHREKWAPVGGPPPGKDGH
ncbi:VOC family protein [Noviherbaspirillum saxi]|uniref:Glyoxalase n=1 Tax=Noviherbaspirillum saxi TaxID=2320863 RepID=A0A3A3FKF6_9BURK|nr:VOC family protein [Noviherbaspirillum saxi]RJF95787.1 glyoxalase [Noviherbaspirillum saxi]